MLLSQRSEFSVMRDLNYSKLTLCRLQTVSATARGKVYQVSSYTRGLFTQQGEGGLTA